MDEPMTTAAGTPMRALGAIDDCPTPAEHAATAEPAADDDPPPESAPDDCPDPDFLDPRSNPWTGEEPPWHKGGFEW